jgi:hypothetical protein
MAAVTRGHRQQHRGLNPLCSTIQSRQTETPPNRGHGSLASMGRTKLARAQGFRACVLRDDLKRIVPRMRSCGCRLVDVPYVCQNFGGAPTMRNLDLSLTKFGSDGAHYPRPAVAGIGDVAAVQGSAMLRDNSGNGGGRPKAPRNVLGACPDNIRRYDDMEGITGSGD